MKTTPCECGCGRECLPRQLQTVRITRGAPRFQGTTIFRDASSYRVHVDCVKPFKRELRAQERIRNTLAHLLTLRRLSRLRYLARLWLLRGAALERRLGTKTARNEAWLTVLFALRAPRVTSCPRSSV